MLVHHGSVLNAVDTMTCKNRGSITLKTFLFRRNVTQISSLWLANPNYNRHYINKLCIFHIRSITFHFQMDLICLLQQFLAATVQQKKVTTSQTSAAQFRVLALNLQRKLCMCSLHLLPKIKGSVLSSNNAVLPISFERRIELPMEQAYTRSGSTQLCFRQCNYRLRSVLQKILSYHSGNCTVIIKQLKKALLNSDNVVLYSKLMFDILHVFHNHIEVFHLFNSGFFCMSYKIP